MRVRAKGTVMFRLIKIEYGRENVPEPLVMPAKAGVVYQKGAALSLDPATGALVLATGEAPCRYLCLCDKTAGEGDTVTCCRVYPQMLFEVPLAAFTDAVRPGAMLGISADGCTLLGTAATYGALVEDTRGASAAGDVLQVRFI